MFQRKLTFEEAVKRALLDKYCDFEGRASRSEYWWFYLFGVIVNFAITILGMALGKTAEGIISLVVGLALLLPSLGVAVRRLHDIGKSGWWLLIGLIPIVGWILLIVWLVGESQPQTNEYGPVPNVEDGDVNVNSKY